jgi:hypothetical protein
VRGHGAHRLGRPHHIGSAHRLGRVRRRMQPGLHLCEPFDQALQRVVHGFKRILGALIAFCLIGVQRLEVVPDRLVVAARNVGCHCACDALGGRDRFLTRLAHLQRQLLDAALDPADRISVRRLDLFGDPTMRRSSARQGRPDCAEVPTG